MLEHRQIQRHFRKVDPVLGRVIDAIGPAALKPRRDRFKILVTSIVSQQISTAAARTIRKRLEAYLEPQGVKPANLATRGVDELRPVGLSRQKASYLIDLAQKCESGAVPLSKLGRLSDEEVIAALTQVKGIGRWSAQMFLIFSLGRLDVFPHDDLGVRAAIRQIYGLPEMPDKVACLAVGERWRPYATIGSWYCWRYLEHAARQKNSAK